jgi:hypothetical protein
MAIVDCEFIRRGQEDCYLLLLFDSRNGRHKNVLRVGRCSPYLGWSVAQVLILRHSLLDHIVDGGIN